MTKTQQKIWFEARALVVRMNLEVDKGGTIAVRNELRWGPLVINEERKTIDDLVGSVIYDPEEDKTLGSARAFFAEMFAVYRKVDLGR